jgi:hypothetical protein
MRSKPKFINADDLVAELRDDLEQDCNRYMYWYQKEERDSKYIFAIDRIEEAPTADVVEVVHGRWIEKYVYDPDPHDRLRYRCSICGRTEEYRELYCHCGAKMDGDKNGKL